MTSLSPKRMRTRLLRFGSSGKSLKYQKKNSFQKTRKWDLGVCERQLATSLDSIHPGHVARYKFALLKAEGFILDAACGCGYGSKMLDTVGMVTGVDLEPEAIDFADRYYPGPTYKVGNVCEPQGVFDWVVSFETIEHLKNPEKALKCFRESKNLLISTPNSERFIFDPKSYSGDKYPHLRHYSSKELEELLNSTGWEVVEKRCQIEKTSQVTLGGGGKFHVWACK